MKTIAFGSNSKDDSIHSFEIERRKPGPKDVVLEIHFCGICHSDIHTVRSEWGPAHYPCVPGHEIVGKVIEVGKKVRRFRAGDLAGVGCLIDSCGKCSSCKNHEEQFCLEGPIWTYNSIERDGKTVSLGGYSRHIVVKEEFMLKIKKGLPLDRVAPLLCAGITTYSPLKRFKVKKGSKVGVVGLGGLGHMAVKLAKAMGAEVTVFSTSPHKEKDARRLGAKNFILSSKPDQVTKAAGTLDVLINTVAAPHDFSPFLNSLKIGGSHVLVGVAPEPNQVQAFALIGGRKNLTGSLIGGIKETQEMLDFCARKKVFSDIELIQPDQINEAYEKTIQGKVKYRFVVDIAGA